MSSEVITLQGTLASLTKAYREVSYQVECFQQENADLKRENRLLQESVTRLQEDCSQYETDLDEARNLAGIYKEESLNLKDKLRHQVWLQNENKTLNDLVTQLQRDLDQARNCAVQIKSDRQIPDAVLDVNANGCVVIKINFK